jgi:hypothetical protein
VFLTDVPSTCPKMSHLIVVSMIPSTCIVDHCVVLFSVMLSISILSVSCKNHCMTTITINPMLINHTATTGAKIERMMFFIEKFFRKSDSIPIHLSPHNTDAMISSGAKLTANHIVTILNTLITINMIKIMTNISVIDTLVIVINISTVIVSGIFVSYIKSCIFRTPMPIYMSGQVTLSSLGMILSNISSSVSLIFVSCAFV